MGRIDMKMGSKYMVLAIIWGLTVAGCAELGVDAPRKHEYVFDVERSGEESGAGSGKVLEVRPFRVSSRFEGTELVYRTGDLRYETDFYNVFLSGPAGNISEEVRQWLGQSGLFASVVHPVSQVDTTLVMEGDITALYGDYQDLSNPKAVMEIEVLVMDNTGGDHAIEYHDVYRVEIALESRRAEELVTGLNKCLEGILQAMEQDLRESAILQE